ncbi:MAG: AI-2E family transporter, partial [Theionarchaea archaeon]|nr:AI-2E family transporter [Theionarchaea archaeon]MBU7048323.1 AI-2E family transporter [Theionarchaea archaeon]
TAFATGIISIPIYYGFDVPYPFLMVVLTAFLALLPILGAYLLYFPIAVGLYFDRGLVVSVVFFGLCAFFIGVFPDILVRPLTARTKEVGAVPLLVGFLSGLLVFGVSGIVLGPLMIITATAFWRVYIKEN